jgi:high-affinity K+ transport system ATPase subunit B
MFRFCKEVECSPVMPAIKPFVGFELENIFNNPGQKEMFIKSLKESGKIVAMVGDGINDSQALAQADVSIAMGKGSDIAMDVAQMTILVLI